MNRSMVLLILLPLATGLSGCTLGEETDQRPPGLGIDWVNNYHEPVYIEYQLPGGNREPLPGPRNPNEGSGTSFGDCVPGETWILLAAVDEDDRVLHEKEWTELECGQYEYTIDENGVGDLALSPPDEPSSEFQLGPLSGLPALAVVVLPSVAVLVGGIVGWQRWRRR